MASACSHTLDRWLTRADERPAYWLAACALLLAMQISSLWYATPDALAYLSIARRVAAGGAWTKLGDAQLGMPIGYPVLISPAFLTGERPFLLLSAMHWLMAVAFMLGVYRWARDQLGTGALWLTGLVMLNVVVWILYRRALSECAFLAVMIWLVNAVNGALASAPHSGAVAQVLRWLATAALLALLSAIREAGALFGAGLAVAVVVRARLGALRWRVAAGALIATSLALALAALAWRPERLAAARPAFAGNLAGYADAGSAVANTLAARLHLRMTEIGQLLVPGMFKASGSGWLDINTLVYAPLLAAVCWGWWRLVRRGGDVLTYTAPLYVGLHLAWPYAAGTRYMLPLLPLLVACLWTLVESHRRRALVMVVAMVLHGGVALGYWLIIDRPRAVACQRAVSNVERLAAAIDPADAGDGAAAVPACVQLGLEMALDRRVRAYRDGVPPRDASWIITDAPTFAAAGFSLRQRAGPHALLVRTQRATDGAGP